MKQIQKFAALLAATALILCLFAGCGSNTVDNAGGTCTLSISCESVLDNMDDLTEGKEDLIPDDGWMIAPTEVSFAKDETVMDMLERELQKRNMHFEVEGSGTSAYVTGIGNLYQMDCGDMSGWTFYVNGEYPEIGFGSYQLTDGDVVELIYVCSFD